VLVLHEAMCGCIDNRIDPTTLMHACSNADPRLDLLTSLLMRNRPYAWTRRSLVLMA